MNKTRPVCVFAPGAGAPSSHPWMKAWKERLASLGDVTTFDYDYMAERRGRPDPLPVLIARHRRALEEARQPSRPAILVGKSMGGRIGCHVALEEPVAGVVCFGYPLCGGGDPRKMRDKVLRDLKTPILFIQGTRDPLCPLDLLENVRREMTAPNFLHVVDGGDHSLIVGKRHLAAAGEKPETVDAKILEAIEQFLATSLSSD
jgi:predicted alpha/beta-hydrolase family hydrolase